MNADPEEMGLELIEIEDELVKDQETIDRMRRSGVDTGELRKDLNDKAKALEKLRQHFYCTARSKTQPSKSTSS
jgi:hypothetical protein